MITPIRIITVAGFSAMIGAGLTSAYLYHRRVHQWSARSWERQRARRGRFEALAIVLVAVCLLAAIFSLT